MSAALQPVKFNFDHVDHVYTDAAGQKLPHITGMLVDSGVVDDTWFTDDSSDRGTAVHDLTASYDLGALDPRTLVSPFRGYLLAHVAAMQVLRPTHLAIEEPEVHPIYGFGGRPDRVSKIYNVLSIYEVKTAAQRWTQWRGERVDPHAIQTAIQAILVAWRYGLEPHHLQRMAGYYKNNGKYNLQLHKDRNDYDRAFRIIKEYRRV